MNGKEQFRKFITNWNLLLNIAACVRVNMKSMNGLNACVYILSSDSIEADKHN